MKTVLKFKQFEQILNEKHDSIFDEVGLIVKPSTNSDRELLKNYFDNSVYYAEFNSEWY